MTRPITTMTSTDAARRGWETRKANESSRAQRFDEVLADNQRLKAALRDLLVEIRTSVVNSSSPVYQAAERLVGK